MIKLSNITKVFQQGNRSIQALNNVSLHVPARQIYGVIGASGAGKSTLIRCVNLLERPTEGSVQVDGQELTALSEKELTRARRQIDPFPHKLIRLCFAKQPATLLAAAARLCQL